MKSIQCKKDFKRNSKKDSVKEFDVNRHYSNQYNVKKKFCR